MAGIAAAYNIGRGLAARGRVFPAAAIILLATAIPALAQSAGSKPILAGPLAKLDIKPAEVATQRGKPQGTLTVGQHFGLDPGWLNPVEHQLTGVQQEFDYFVHDALIKPMPQGDATYSLAEHAEMTADYKKAAFRLRAGLKFQDGSPLTSADVKWTYENFKGARAKQFHDKTERIEVVDDRTVVFHFKEPFADFMNLYNGYATGIGWIVSGKYYEKVGKDGFKQQPMGAGPFKLVSQQAGSEMVFEAWEGYWRRTPGVQKIVVKAVRDPASRLAGLQTGELDLAFGMTGKLLPRVLNDKTLRWDKNYTSAWFLTFPGYNEKDSPFHDKRVREAISLALNRAFLSKQETQGIGPPWGNWLSSEQPDVLRGDGTDLPVPEYNPEKAKKLLAEAGFPNGFEFDWLVPFPPYFDLGQRIIADLGAIGVRGKLEVLEGPAYQAKNAKGRKGFAGNRTIVQRIDVRAAWEAIPVLAVCDAPSAMICEPKIDELWKKREASLDPEERESLTAEIQNLLIKEYYFVPIYMNPFVHAVGPKVLPEDDGFHRYWETKRAPFPYPWEIWEVKKSG
jgi:peptide/nickel transport system substrate-binding protein